MNTRKFASAAIVYYFINVFSLFVTLATSFSVSQGFLNVISIIFSLALGITYIVFLLKKEKGLPLFILFLISAGRGFVSIFSTLISASGGMANIFSLVLSLISIPATLILWLTLAFYLASDIFNSERLKAKRGAFKKLFLAFFIVKAVTTGISTIIYIINLVNIITYSPGFIYYLTWFLSISQSIMWLFALMSLKKYVMTEETPEIEENSELHI